MNITVSADEKIIERARKVAQTMGKSLNQAVRDYLGLAEILSPSHGEL